jgi:hypothetical protein
LIVREGRRSTYYPDSALGGGHQAAYTFESIDVSRFRVLMNGESSPSASMQALDDPCARAEAPRPDEVLLLVQVNPAAACSDEVTEELRAWGAYVDHQRPVTLAAPTCMAVLYSKLLGNGFDPTESPSPLPGFQAAELGIHDQLCELRYAVHPTAFFQV